MTLPSSSNLRSTLGSPPVWKQPNLPLTLAQDSGKTFVDQNAHRVSAYPLLPLFAAVLHTKNVTSEFKIQAFDMASVELVTDRNGLRKLLRWIQGGVDVKDFRIDVDLVGNAVLFTRREPRTEDDVFGYGKAFERLATRHDPQETGHHRIVTYSLNGVKMLVRFELDACLPDSGQSTIASSASQDTALEMSTLADAFNQLSYTPNGSTSFTTVGVEIATGGVLVDQSLTMELKTRSRTTWDPVRRARVPNSIDWAESYLQLFLSQTQHHALGWHDRGTFTTIEHVTLAKLGERAEAKAQQANLRKLSVVLRQVVDAVKVQGDGKLLSLVCEDGVLTLRHRHDRPDGALPQELVPLLTA
ncbi:hypothetical protein BKA62DRAFT_627461 [Auriculariales sp. MPI-PUGE-AT-0066]|nr:hypothetical protein BKA62DRAFT_627461 [Auriculariales sp. MPI-PUGE-AT-0066]